MASVSVCLSADGGDNGTHVCQTHISPKHTRSNTVMKLYMVMYQNKLELGNYPVQISFWICILVWQEHPFTTRAPVYHTRCNVGPSERWHVKPSNLDSSLKLQTSSWGRTRDPRVASHKRYLRLVGYYVFEKTVFNRFVAVLPTNGKSVYPFVQLKPGSQQGIFEE